MEVRSKTFTWDWKDEPDWEEINQWIKEIGCRPYFYRYPTGDDDLKVIVTDTPVLPEELDLLYDDN